MTDLSLYCKCLSEHTNQPEERSLTQCWIDVIKVLVYVNHAPETVFREVLVKMPDKNSRDTRYILARFHMGLNDLRIARFKQSRILDSRLGDEVRIPGMFADKHYKRELLPRRIREAMPEIS